MNRLTVTLHGQAVAALVGFGDDLDTHDFVPERAWVRRPRHDVLGQLWEDRGGRSLRTHGLTPWFEHLLPRGPMRRSVAREAGVDESDGLALLAWLSRDLLGAVGLEVGPDLPYVPRPRRELEVASDGARYRCSLPGNQWKLSLSEGSGGYTLPAHGVDGEWIAKFPTGNFPRMVEVEAATMAWADASGVAVPEVREEPVGRIATLPSELPCDEGMVYLIRRFDRGDSGRIHTEDFGQILDTPPGSAQFASHYEHLGAVIARLCPPEDLRAFLRQLVFCMLCGNFDAHTKNWSVVYADRRHARLSPAYDLLATVVYPQLDAELALHLAGHRSPYDLGRARFAPMARAVEVEEQTIWTWVREATDAVRGAWRDPTLRARFAPSERKRIDAHLERCQSG